jgi:hypothetical protein
MAETKRRIRLDPADELRMVWLEARAVDWDGRDQGTGLGWVRRGRFRVHWLVGVGGGLGLSEGKGNVMGGYIHSLYIPLVQERSNGGFHQRIMCT